MQPYTPTSIQALTQKPNLIPTIQAPTNAPGAMQYSSGGQATMMPPNISSSTPSTVINTANPTIAPEPTIGETLTGIKSEAMRIQDILNNRAGATGTLNNPSYETGPTYEELYPEIDESKVARNQRRLFQSEIDATNRVYDDILAQERLAGQGRLGTGRAISARSGLLGSDFGEAQRSNIVGFNQQSESAVQNERMAKIGSIMGTMRKAVADEITEKRLARQQGAENYISYLASAQERKANNRNLAARAIMDAGLDPTTMDTKELEAVGKEAGLSAQEIIMAYKDMQAASEAESLKTSKTQAEINKIEADIARGKLVTIGEGTMLYDTETGETFKNPKTYAPGTGSGSSVSLTPDDKRNLLGGGWSESDIAAIESDVRTYGLTEAIANAKQNGATTTQIKAMEKAYGSMSEDTDESKLTRENLATFFDLTDDTSQSSFLGLEYGDTNAEKLNTLENLVNRYRAVGYSDKDILKEMGL